MYMRPGALHSGRIGSPPTSAGEHSPRRQVLVEAITEAVDALAVLGSRFLERFTETPIKRNDRTVRVGTKSPLEKHRIRIFLHYILIRLRRHAVGTRYEMG
jgi:hypothetical protein